MSRPVITVENLSKAYRIGLKEKVPDTLTAALTGWVRAPLRNWKRLRGLDVSRSVRRAAAANGRADTGAAADGQAETDDLFWALRNVSFEIQQGEVLGIIGGNGAGKSTLLKILSRITEPTSGRAIIRGRVSSLLEVGTGFHPELTGRENIYMNGTLLGMRKREIDRRFDEIVDFSGVERFLDTPIKRYSSGMKVRLAFAVAAHLEPEVMVIDEVLAVGDADFQQKCLGKMQDVATSGRTVLFVSHNMNAVRKLCTQGLILQQGRRLAFGPVDEVVTDYLSGSDHYNVVEIAKRLDREGDGSARCTGIWFEDADGKQTESIVAGGLIRICLKYELYVESLGFEFRVGIYDQQGMCLAHNATDYSPLRSAAIPRSGIATCEIHRLPLAPGNYFVNSSIVRSSGIRADRVRQAATFSVETVDLYGSGRIPGADVSPVIMDYTWNAEERWTDADCRSA